MERLTGRVIYGGNASGTILKSEIPISFFGGVDPNTGLIKEPNHPLFGESIAAKVLVFPHAKGSTVGSYILYALKKNGAAPSAMILGECETIVAVGAIISEIPTVDQVAVDHLEPGDVVKINGREIIVEKKSDR